jgi:hypothetical protein
MTRTSSGDTTRRRAGICAPLVRWRIRLGIPSPLATKSASLPQLAQELFQRVCGLLRPFLPHPVPRISENANPQIRRHKLCLRREQLAGWFLVTDHKNRSALCGASAWIWRLAGHGMAKGIARGYFGFPKMGG